VSASTCALDTSSHAPPTRGALRRVGPVGVVGTTIEWFDVSVSGTAAALVLGPGPETVHRDLTAPARALPEPDVQSAVVPVTTSARGY
jgi:hypothetical protein